MVKFPVKTIFAVLAAGSWFLWPSIKLLTKGTKKAIAKTSLYEGYYHRGMQYEKAGAQFLPQAVRCYTEAMAVAEPILGDHGLLTRSYRLAQTTHSQDLIPLAVQQEFRQITYGFHLLSFLYSDAAWKSDGMKSRLKELARGNPAGQHVLRMAAKKAGGSWLATRRENALVDIIAKHDTAAVLAVKPPHAEPVRSSTEIGLDSQVSLPGETEDRIRNIANTNTAQLIIQTLQRRPRHLLDAYRNLFPITDSEDKVHNTLLKDKEILRLSQAFCDTFRRWPPEDDEYMIQWRSHRDGQILTNRRIYFTPPKSSFECLAPIALSELDQYSSELKVFTWHSCYRMNSGEVVTATGPSCLTESLVNYFRDLRRTEEV